MISLVRENQIRCLIDERLREFTPLDIRRAYPAVFAVPWVPDLTPEERKFEREYREQKLIEIRARFPGKDKKREERVMRHHPLAPEIPCPHCGRPGLQYVTSRYTSDKYICSACRHTAVHLSNGNRKEGRGCGLRASLSGRLYGPLRPCGR